MKKVLIVTYYFPPFPTIGSLRLEGLAKYLPEFGWEVSILTAKLPASPDPKYNVFETPYPGDVSSILKKKMSFEPSKGLQEQLNIPEAVSGKKNALSTKIIAGVRSFIAYPDEQKNWVPNALEYGNDLLSTSNYNAIISSSSPVSSHIIANRLKMDFNIPWIADLRDLWTQNPYYPFSRLRKFFEKRLESNTFKNANAMVSTSQIWADDLKSFHKDKPVFSIPNGFDPENLNSGKKISNKKFTITYTGQLYQGKRDPELLFIVCRDLLNENKIKEADFLINFFGPNAPWLKTLIQRYNLENIVKLNGVISHEESKKQQRNSHLLLMLSWNEPKEEGTYTGKIFEYLAASRPILGIGGPKGVLSELYSYTNVGHHITNANQLKVILTNYLKEFKSTGDIKFNGIQERISQFSHIEMARSFSIILDTLNN